MPIRYRCPQCSQLLGIGVAQAGQLTQCPICGAAHRVPAALSTDRVPIARTEGRGLIRSPAPRPAGRAASSVPESANGGYQPPVAARRNEPPQAATGPIKFRCPRCRSLFAVDVLLAGRPGRCMKCGFPVTIPSQEVDEPTTRAALPNPAAKPVPDRAPNAVSNHGERAKPTRPAVAWGTRVIAAPKRRALKAPPSLLDSINAVAGFPQLAPGLANSISIYSNRGETLMRQPAAPLHADPSSPGWRDRAPPDGDGSEARQASDGVPAPSSDRNDATSQIGLKPVSINESRNAARLYEESEDEPGPYQLAPLPRERRPPSTRPAGFLKSSYRGGFRRLARVFRWMNETAYGISILFLMLTCVGFAMQVYANLDSPSSEKSKPSKSAEMAAQANDEGDAQSEESAQEIATPAHEAPHKSRPHWMILTGIAGIVVLNLVRLAAGIANLVVIPFRADPVRGVLFLVPPLTFVYLWRHWYQLRKPVGRIVGPLFALALVVAAYMNVPGLSQAGRGRGNLRSQIERSVGSIKHDVSGELGKAGQNVNSLKREVQKRLPGELETARKALKGAKERVDKAVDDYNGKRTGDESRPGTRESEQNSENSRGKGQTPPSEDKDKRN